MEDLWGWKEERIQRKEKATGNGKVIKQTKRKLTRKQSQIKGKDETNQKK
jgi:hypothetical protein